MLLMTLGVKWCQSSKLIPRISKIKFLIWFSISCKLVKPWLEMMLYHKNWKEWSKKKKKLKGSKLLWKSWIRSKDNKIRKEIKIKLFNRKKLISIHQINRSKNSNHLVKFYPLMVLKSRNSGVISQILTKAEVINTPITQIWKIWPWNPTNKWKKMASCETWELKKSDKQAPLIHQKIIITKQLLLIYQRTSHIKSHHHLERRTWRRKVQYLNHWSNLEWVQYIQLHH